MKPSLHKRLVFLRNRFRLAGIKLAAGRFEVFNTYPKDLSIWKPVDTWEEALELANQLVRKHTNSVFNVWSPGQEHLYQVENRDGKITVLHATRPTREAPPAKSAPTKQLPHWPSVMKEHWQKAAGHNIVVEGLVYRRVGGEAVEDIGFDGFISVLDPEIDKKHKNWRERVRSPRDLRTTIPEITSEDLVVVHGKPT